MANIIEHLKKFMNAKYGKDVKQEFHDCVLELNNEAEESTKLSKETQTRQDRLEKKYDEQIKNIASSEPQNAEIVDARQGFDTLGSIIKQKVYHFENVQAMKNCLTLISRRCSSNDWVL